MVASRQSVGSGREGFRMPARWRERWPRNEGRRTKATEEGTRGKAERTWLSMGIWGGSEFGGRWFSRGR